MHTANSKSVKKKAAKLGIDYLVAKPVRFELLKGALVSNGIIEANMSQDGQDRDMS